MMSQEDDSIPEPILKLRKKSAATQMRNFDSSGEERANNDRKRPHEENDDVGNDSKLLCREIGLESNQDPPARERPAVCILLSFVSYMFCQRLHSHFHCLHMKGWKLATTRVAQLYSFPCVLWQWIYNARARNCCKIH